ncbi:MAG: hypothetical protein HN350_03765 [Phycisphaerales bacterium]|nr:hypothetical protein [Phycisphaerales bacterium]
MNMHVIAAAIEEYRVVEAANGYPALTADNWIPKLAAASESRKIINSLPNNVWSPERKTEFCDAWGNPLVLLPNGGPNGTAQLISAGPDGDITTPDDNVRFHK